MQPHRLRRRQFITLLSGAVAAWPLVARALNLQTAKALGLTAPTALLMRADEVIE